MLRHLVLALALSFPLAAFAVPPPPPPPPGPSAQFFKPDELLARPAAETAKAFAVEFAGQYTAVSSNNFGQFTYYSAPRQAWTGLCEVDTMTVSTVTRPAGDAYMTALTLGHRYQVISRLADPDKPMDAVNRCGPVGNGGGYFEAPKAVTSIDAMVLLQHVIDDSRGSGRLNYSLSCGERNFCTDARAKLARAEPVYLREVSAEIDEGLSHDVHYALEVQHGDELWFVKIDARYDPAYNPSWVLPKLTRVRVGGLPF